LLSLEELAEVQILAVEGLAVPEGLVVIARQ
jgi:hypothetical protein